MKICLHSHRNPRHLRQPISGRFSTDRETTLIGECIHAKQLPQVATSMHHPTEKEKERYAQGPTSILKRAIQQYQRISADLVHPKTLSIPQWIAKVKFLMRSER